MNKVRESQLESVVTAQGDGNPAEIEIDTVTRVLVEWIV